MTFSSSELVLGMVLRELEDGVRQDGLWLQALSESAMDQTKARQRYIALRCEALQSQMKGALIQQIRGAMTKDAGGGAKASAGQSMADYLMGQGLGKKKS